MGIFVGNLDSSVTENNLKELFEKKGNVKSVKIILDKDTKQSKGFAFVEMHTLRDSIKAISSLNGVELNGKFIKVIESSPDK